jgi:hypothetical protein
LWLGRSTLELNLGYPGSHGLRVPTCIEKFRHCVNRRSQFGHRLTTGISPLGQLRSDSDLRELTRLGLFDLGGIEYLTQPRVKVWFDVVLSDIDIPRVMYLSIAAYSSG